MESEATTKIIEVDGVVYCSCETLALSMSDLWLTHSLEDKEETMVGKGVFGGYGWEKLCVLGESREIAPVFITFQSATRDQIQTAVKLNEEHHGDRFYIAEREAICGLASLNVQEDYRNDSFLADCLITVDEFIYSSLTSSLVDQTISGACFTIAFLDLYVRQESIPDERPEKLLPWPRDTNAYIRVHSDYPQDPMGGSAIGAISNVQVEKYRKRF